MSGTFDPPASFRNTPALLFEPVFLDSWIESSNDLLLIILNFCWFRWGRWELTARLSMRDTLGRGCVFCTITYLLLVPTLDLGISSALLWHHLGITSALSGHHCGIVSALFRHHLALLRQDSDVGTDVGTDGGTDAGTGGGTDGSTSRESNRGTDGRNANSNVVPAAAPSDAPTDVPTDEPTDVPTGPPTTGPTDGGTDGPTDGCTDSVSNRNHQRVRQRARQRAHQRLHIRGIRWAKGRCDECQRRFPTRGEIGVSSEWLDARSGLQGPNTSSDAGTMTPALEKQDAGNPDRVLRQGTGTVLPLNPHPARRLSMESMQSLGGTHHIYQTKASKVFGTESTFGSAALGQLLGQLNRQLSDVVSTANALSKRHSLMKRQIRS